MARQIFVSPLLFGVHPIVIVVSLNVLDYRSDSQPEDRVTTTKAWQLRVSSFEPHEVLHSLQREV